MSTLSVTTINTANATTDLTFATGNSAAGKIVINSAGGLVLSQNSSSNSFIANTSGVYINGNVAFTSRISANGGVGTAGQFLTSAGTTGNVYWSTAPSAILGRNVYTSTQTITIPAGATSADVTMVGAGGGGAGGSPQFNCPYWSGATGGAGAVLTKLLTSLTAGLTLSLTVGSGGSGGGVNSSGSNGSADTILASGTQSITTLTAQRGTGGIAGLCAPAGSPGAATNGDINITGFGTLTPFGFGYPGSPATGYGAAGVGGGENNSGFAGAPGLCIITWYR